MNAFIGILLGILMFALAALLVAVMLSFFVAPDRYNYNRVVVFKTHTWNDDIEAFAKKVKKECQCDFVILAHNDDGTLLSKIKDVYLKKSAIVITEQDIRSVYPSGFVSLWLSNHWNTMWYYKNKGMSKYKYYWFVEYDVRIVGNSVPIWTYNGTEDFVFPNGPFQNPNWAFKDDYFGDKLNDTNKWYGYLQLARYSKEFLDYLDITFATGENGQDEMMMFSLLKRSGMKGTDHLSKYVRESWTADYRDSDKHKEMIKRANTSTLTIYHPVK